MMVLRIIRTPNGEERILYSDGRYVPVSDDRLRQALQNQSSAAFLRCDGSDWWEIQYDRMEDVEGVTLAYIDDKGNLVITEANPFLHLLVAGAEDDDEQDAPAAAAADAESIEYISIDEYAASVGRHPSRVRVLCRQGRFPTAKKISSRWVIPKDTPFPADNRFVEHPKRPRRKRTTE